MASPALEEDPQNVENLMWINTRSPLRSGCQRLSDDTAADGTRLEPLAVRQSAFHNLEKNFN